MSVPLELAGPAVDAAFASGECNAGKPATATLPPEPPKPSDVISCFASISMLPGLGQNNLPSTLWDTRDWLITFNGAVERGIESLYPDKGTGSGPIDQQDDTIVVREDYPAGRDGAAVASIVVLGGRHNLPGDEGAHPPCNDQSCDIRAVDEILDFWRAEAGFRNLWR